MAFIDWYEVKEELVVFFRNQAILTVAERSVTNTTATGTFAGETSLTISRTNVKNIKSVTVASVTKSLGTDYTVDYDFDNSGTIACKISFTSGQTGAYTIDYDYGTDAIFPDYPRPDLNLSNYPRVAVDILGSDSTELALGGATVNTSLSITVVVYAATAKRVEEIIKSARNAIMNNKKAFYHIKFISPIGTGPLIKSPDRHDKIVQRNIDFISPLNFEEA